jgi:peptidoglycan DL-endopeptidase CwlO
METGGQAHPRPGRQALRRAGERGGTTLGTLRRPALTLALLCTFGASSLAVGSGTAGAAASGGSSSTTAATGASRTGAGTASQQQINTTEAQASALATQISQQQSVLAQADERYNQAVVSLNTTQASLHSTTASLAAAKAKLANERSQLRADAVKAYIDDTSSSAAAALFSAPTSASQIRTVYRTLSAATVAADVARVKASQQQLTTTEATLLDEQQAQTAQLGQESQTRQSAAAASAQSEATLAQVRGTLGQEVAQQAAVNAAAAARLAAAATTPAKAQAAASQAAQAAQVASTVGSGSPAAVNATTAATQAAGSASGTAGSSGPPVTLSGGGGSQAAGLAAVHGAMQYLNVPYVYGGMSSQGLDCSGLTALAWAKAGVSLPHSAADQYNRYVGTSSVSMGALQPGDLIFFKLAGSPIIDHVVMYVGPTLDGQTTLYGSNTIIEARHTGTVVGFYPYWPDGLVGAVRP